MITKMGAKMPRLEAEESNYSPIYFTKRCLYGRCVFIYGAIGQRIYYGCTSEEATQKYQDEWLQQEMQLQEY